MIQKHEEKLNGFLVKIFSKNNTPNKQDKKIRETKKQK